MVIPPQDQSSNDIISLSFHPLLYFTLLLFILSLSLFHFILYFTLLYFSLSYLNSSLYLSSLDESDYWEGLVKMSCTSPGSINLVIHFEPAAPQFFEMQLSKLMDELLTSDSIVYNGVAFDLRKVIHFINKTLTG